MVFALINGRTLRRGDIFLFQMSGDAYVMYRLYRISQVGTCTFIGDHQYNTEVGISRSQLSGYVFRDGKKINCENGFLRSLLTISMIIRVRRPGLVY